MATSVEMFPCESIAIKLPFASEAPFTLFVTVDNQSHEFDSLDRERIIYETFSIPGFDVKF
jgi:hypothetical protein